MRPIRRYPSAEYAYIQALTTPILKRRIRRILQYPRDQYSDTPIPMRPILRCSYTHATNTPNTYGADSSGWATFGALPCGTVATGTVATGNRSGHFKLSILKLLVTQYSKAQTPRRRLIRQFQPAANPSPSPSTSGKPKPKRKDIIRQYHPAISPGNSKP
jgi:hypothetical protein